MASPHSNDWARARSKFIEAGGATTQSFGLGRLVGQMYALLYLSSRPLCLDEMSAALGVSKASVSIAVRQLEVWLAVRRLWVKGDRKDYYEAETDFRTVLRSGLLDTVRRKLNTAGAQIGRTEEILQVSLKSADGETRRDLDTVAKRLQHARKFHKKISRLIDNPVVDSLI